MSFLKQLVRIVTRRTVMLEDNEYAQWTKEQLIEKIIHLENESKRSAEDILDIHESKKVKPATTVKDISKPQRKFDFSKYHTRFIALRFAYLGWNYNGLAIQKEATPLPTVEGTILEVMNKCKLVPSMLTQEFNFSRCGRTDKGVSAMNQVISLNVRSNLTPEEQLDPSNDPKEIPYVHILNQLLPEDIKVTAVCLRPPNGFDARFSCKYRHYKYFFNKTGVDIAKMEIAAKYYEGEHDFRNFCKVDGSKQITNYRRVILSSKILHIKDDMYCFDLIGTAFLWHQVRCMMANLFLVGQGLEDASIIEHLLDVEKFPQRPVYDMASDVPLVLYDCKFENLEWFTPDMTSEKASKWMRTVNAVELGYQLKTTIANSFRAMMPNGEHNRKTLINIGDGKGKVIGVYQKLADRELMDTVDVVNSKFRARKARKSQVTGLK